MIPRLPSAEQHRRGGYFCLMPRERRGHSVGTPILVIQVGEVDDPEKRHKYYKFAVEKAGRLHAYADTDSHKSSWQSRHPSTDRWGGAILTNKWIFSFSGLPELADEAIMLFAAITLGFMERADADAIARISDNQLYFKLFVQRGWSDHNQTVWDPARMT